MKIRQLFTAKDNLGRNFTYRYEGELPQPNGYNIKLRNLSDSTDTFVEPEWFNQRKINLI